MTVVHIQHFCRQPKSYPFVTGRIIGKSKDTLDNECYKIALQTENNIFARKAISNICTAQSLLTNAVSMFSMYHGKDGL